MSAPAEILHPDGKTESLHPADGQRFTSNELEAVVGGGCEVRRGPAGYVIACKFGGDRAPNESMPGFVGAVIVIEGRQWLHELPDDF